MRSKCLAPNKGAGFGNILFIHMKQSPCFRTDGQSFTAASLQKGVNFIKLITSSFHQSKMDTVNLELQLNNANNTKHELMGD